MTIRDFRQECLLPDLRIFPAKGMNCGHGDGVELTLHAYRPFPWDKTKRRLEKVTFALYNDNCLKMTIKVRDQKQPIIIRRWYVQYCSVLESIHKRWAQLIDLCAEKSTKMPARLIFAHDLLLYLFRLGIEFPFPEYVTFEMTRARGFRFSFMSPPHYGDDVRIRTVTAQSFTGK